MHGLAVLIPIRVFARNRPVVVDQPVERFGHVEDACRSVDLHPRSAEVIAEHADRDVRVPADVVALVPVWVGGNGEVAGGGCAASDRRQLGPTTPLHRAQHPLVPGPDEFEEFREVDTIGCCHLRSHGSNVGHGSGAGGRRTGLGHKKADRPGSEEGVPHQTCRGCPAGRCCGGEQYRAGRSDWVPD